MIKLENYCVSGWEAAIRGMRNPMNSWNKSDTVFRIDDGPVGYDISRKPIDLYGGMEWDNSLYISHEQMILGERDYNLMMHLARAGSVDAKYRRMINVTVDITAPLYWWKEFDTYKVGTVANSCSTMHKIAAKEFTLDDFSLEHLISITEMNKMTENKPSLVYDFSDEEHPNNLIETCPLGILVEVISMLNICRDLFIKTKDKKYWWQMIQLLPSSYNQKRTVQMNYEVLAGIYPKRKEHKLDEWRGFCEWIKILPYSEIITLLNK